MKKMLAKAVALSLVLGGVGFVANDALAAEIGPAVDVETIYGDWDKVLSHKDGEAINAEVATNKANIATKLLPIKQTLLKMQKISLLTKKQLIKK